MGKQIWNYKGQYAFSPFMGIRPSISKNKKNEEYIKTGQMGYNSNVIYLTEKQKYIKK